MGFQIPPRAVVLTFGPDTEYAGAEVRCRRKAPLHQALAFERCIAADDPDAEDIARAFGENVLLSWNLEDVTLDENGSTVTDEDGNPLLVSIPCNADTFLEQPGEFVLLVMQHWKEAVTGVDAPLASNSPAGQPSAAQLTTVAA